MSTRHDGYTEIVSRDVGHLTVAGSDVVEADRRTNPGYESEEVG
jgi:hypothetical protein